MSDHGWGLLLVTDALRYTGIGMFLFGCLVVWAALRLRWMRPPGWVREYNGHGSIGLGLLFAGVWLISFITLALDGFIPSFVQLPILWVGMVAAVMSVVGTWFWFPRFLCPRWYVRARAAGVDTRSPDAVQQFRELPVERQRELASHVGRSREGGDGV